MADLSTAVLQIKGIFAACYRIAERLGAAWPLFEAQVRTILQQLATREEDDLRRLVDTLMELGLRSPAKDIFREIGRQSRAAKVMDGTRSLRSEYLSIDVSTDAIEGTQQLRQVSSDFLNELAQRERQPVLVEEEVASPLPVEPVRSERRINAWIGEREADRGKPLIIRQPYTLKFNVGEPHTGSLITAAAANVPLSEIPDEGLETVWVITSDSVELTVAPPNNNVEVDATDAPASWTATFELRIPKSGESDTRQLRVAPLAAQGADLGIVIFARNTLYRQFRIELNVGEAPLLPGVADDPSAKVAGDVEHARLKYTGLMPQHEWQTPRSTLNICVVGNGKASVSGYVWNAVKQHTGWVGTHADWNLPLARLAGRIKNVRRSADTFRTKFSGELNNIDRRDLEERLSHFKNNTHTFWEDNRADAAHTQVWEQKIATSQELFDLAYYGYELYKTFFPDNTKLRLWLDSLDPDWRINITWSEYIDPNWVAHVPWGLLYTRPPAQGQPVDPMYFWGLRYRFNYLAHNSDSGLSPALGGINATASAYGFYWGDDDQEIVEEVKWQQAEWAKWGNQMFVPDSKLPDSPKQQVLALFNQPPLKPTPLLYFFCHCEMGDGNKPILRFGKTTSPADNIKQTDLSQTPFENGPLVFINACASAASDPYIANELEQTFFERGCRSYLGTVVKVPIRFASRFAKIFYSFFFRDLAPEPVAAGEAVFQARRFLWREYRNIGGLLYAYINMYELYMATESEVDALRDHQ